MTSRTVTVTLDVDPNALNRQMAMLHELAVADHDGFSAEAAEVEGLLDCIKDALADEPWPDWRTYKGAAIRDGHGGWLIWRPMATPAGYWPPADPSIYPQTARTDAALIDATKAGRL